MRRTRREKQDLATMNNNNDINFSNGLMDEAEEIEDSTNIEEELPEEDHSAEDGIIIICSQCNREINLLELRTGLDRHSYGQSRGIEGERILICPFVGLVPQPLPLPQPLIVQPLLLQPLLTHPLLPQPPPVPPEVVQDFNQPIPVEVEAQRQQRPTHIFGAEEGSFDVTFDSGDNNNIGPINNTYLDGAGNFDEGSDLDDQVDGFMD